MIEAIQENVSSNISLNVGPSVPLVLNHELIACSRCSIISAVNDNLKEECKFLQSNYDKLKLEFEELKNKDILQMVDRLNHLNNIEKNI